MAPHGQGGCPMPLQSTHVPPEHSVPLSVHVAFAQQGPPIEPQEVQLPAWQITAAPPSSGTSHCPPSAMQTPPPGWV